MEYIKEGDSILLDSGSTVIELVKNLTDFENLTVITTSLPIADVLCENENIRVVLPGGYLHKNMKSVVGNIAEQTIQNFYCDILFLGADGIDVNFGLSTPTSEEASLAQAMIKTAREVVVLTDSSKFGRRSFAQMAPISVIDTIITDENLSAEDRESLEKANVKVVIV